MDKLVFTALNAIKAQANERQQITNELANVSTVGFKNSYSTALQSIKVGGSGFDSRFFSKVVEDDVINMSPGARMLTGRDLDLSLDGQGVLGVEAPNGDIAFTRRGDLRVSPGGLLVTGNDHPVLAEGGGTILVPAGQKVTFGPDGTVFAQDPNLPEVPAQEIAQLLLRDVSQQKLYRRDDGLFAGAPDVALPNGDIPQGPEPVTISPGTLEGSNASAMDAMVRMIDLSRSFETNIRIMRETKDIDQQGASMMRLA